MAAQKFRAVVGVFVVAALSVFVEARAEDDVFRWLEDVEGERALAWVRAENKRTTDELRSDPRYAQFERQALEIFTSEKRIPYGSLSGGYVYNFWQDKKHVRGLWRRTPLEAYRADDPRWEVILDVDALATTEKENWVFKGVTCLEREIRDRCMVRLSRGGKDAAVQREFSIHERRFLADGFVMPEAKSAFSWIDVNTAVVSTEWSANSQTESGYPRIAKIWKRGTPLKMAKTLFEGEKSDVGVWPYVVQRPEGPYVFVRRAVTFFTNENYARGRDGTLRKLPLPDRTRLMGGGLQVLDGHAIVKIDQPSKQGERALRPGTVVAVNLETHAVEVVVEASNRVVVEDAHVTRSSLLLQILDNVQGQVRRYHRGEQGWRHDSIPLPEKGVVDVITAHAFSEDFMATYSSPTTPDSLFFVGADDRPRKLKSLPSFFDARGVVVEQRNAASADGTQVPYFVVAKRSVLRKGRAPTLLYGYGGFQIPLKPKYAASTGKLWIERGGVFVTANLRGGGEFGPTWHQAALKHDRQRAFDDFHAVAEALEKTGVTTSKKLGIFGRSNGGLLVGVAFTQRPDLYAGVLCEVPLLDMLRYDKLPSGASWIAEYGDPDVAEDRAAIAKYSPYQNLKKGVKYPRAFFLTSTKDDRVHPGHARKMAAKMKAYGKPYYYFENIDGGHASTTDAKQRARRAALHMTYLWRTLGS